MCGEFKGFVCSQSSFVTLMTLGSFLINQRQKYGTSSRLGNKTLFIALLYTDSQGVH